jgi:hypothetical protein
MLQSELSLSVANILQAVTSAALIAIVRALLSVRDRLTTIETKLDDPELGVKAAVISLRKSRHNDSNTLQEHEVRLDGHDRDLERLDSQLTERRVHAHEPAPLDRRAST